MLDAGHYADYNRSPVVSEYWESRRMWQLCELLAEELGYYGFEVLKTRDDPEKDLAVTKRGRMAKGCDLFISLHSNASTSSKTDRVDVYASYDNINNSHALAIELAKTVASVMGVSGGYVKTRKSTKGDWEYYGVLRGASETDCPLYYLIEHSFHTNEYATLWLLDDDNLRSLAKAEAAVVALYFGLVNKGDINCDGKLNMFDLQLIKSAVLGKTELDSKESVLADLNSDGRVNMIDYTEAKKEYFD